MPANAGGIVRRDGISDFILKRVKEQYKTRGSISKEDIFYYVYGFLHSPDYRATFAADLKKSLPRLPLVDDVNEFWAFSKAGRKLADLHLNYETVEPYKGVKVVSAGSTTDEYGYYSVQKMRWEDKEKKDCLLYNSSIRIENIPVKALDYVVNGRTALDWLIERYQVKTDKDSGITNDPNDWAKEHNKPRYILDLLLSVITVSVKTVEIVEALPKVESAFQALGEK
jgi:predicted helicase